MYTRQTGSLETVLHSLVYKLRRSVKNGLVALGAVQNIEGIFHSTIFESLYRAAKEQTIM
jgi:hypothetical protein